MHSPPLSPDHAAQAKAMGEAAERYYAGLLAQAQRHPWARALATKVPAEDVVQEVFTRAIGSGLFEERAGRGEGSLVRALQVVLERVLADQLRRQGAEKWGAATALESLDRIDEETSSPILLELASSLMTPTMSARARELVDLCAKHLEDHEWRVWRLRVVASLGFDEIGEDMNCSAASARGVMHRARKKLILALAELDPGHSPA